jgi:hypothetical protein
MCQIGPIIHLGTPIKIAIVCEHSCANWAEGAILAESQPSYAARRLVITPGYRG